MDRKEVDISYRNKDYTAAIGIGKLPVNEKQYESALLLLLRLEDRRDLNVRFRLNDEEQKDNVPQEILVAAAENGTYMELSYSMEEWDWDHPLLLANDHLTSEEAASVLYSLLVECTDDNEIIFNHFREISSQVYPEKMDQADRK